MPKKNTIKLFYLGGLGENPDPAFRTPLNVSGSEFTLPPVYGYIEVTPRTANRIMSKWKISNKEGTFDAFTTDPRIMRQIQSGQRALSGATNIPPMKKFTVDELQQMLQKAQLEESELKADETDESLPVIVVAEPELKVDETDELELKTDETDVPLPVIADIPLPVVGESLPTKQEKSAQASKPDKTASKPAKAGNKPAKGNK